MYWKIGILIFVFIQILLLGPIFTFLINLLLKKYAKIDFNKSFFFLPFFIFFGKDLKISTFDRERLDEVELSIQYLFFFLNPFYLLIFRIRFYLTIFYNLHMKYINKVPSIDKIKLLPPVNLVYFRYSFLLRASMEIEDRSVFPIYKTNITDLNLYNTHFDPSIPFALLFHTRKGHCKLGSGHIRVSQKKEIGSLSLQGVTWGELISLQDLPIGLLNNELNLKADFLNLKKETHITGFLNFEKLDPEQTIAGVKKNLPFSFRVNWKDYKLPFDLGLKKVISQMLLGLNYTGIFSFTIRLIVSGINKLFLKISDTIKTSSQSQE